MDAEFNTRKRAYRFAIRVIEFTQRLPRNDTARIISNQLIRSATSIGANLVEGQSAASTREFINFIAIALKSANESRYWLYLASDAKLVGADIIKPLIDELEAICKMLAKALITLKKKNSK